ncbi:hypothetical protein [uncultured Algoriphagus sp.]|uniref:hypothetical protein n=1 Tax=uncultured Algoriphagus sp. TaxID=417365 RepID=UPI002598C5A9|nr:hypothetical protein [uncultured Algoriphagus sp.]
MLTNLQRIDTDIVRLQEIPTQFFNGLEEAEEFGDHLFPDWTREVFGGTTLFNKFEAVFNKYKAIEDEASRTRIIQAFTHSNQVEGLCKCEEAIEVIELNDLDESIRGDLDTLFLFLYDTALNYHKFEAFIGTTVADSLKRFVYKKNKLQVCPFCGLEAFLMIDGQSRLALDHWLCKDLFPAVAVNFDNLIPIGDKCNGRPAKGDTNILIDGKTTRNRNVAYYPYQEHHGINTSFSYVNEPSIDGITDEDWQFDFQPTETSERGMFKSWSTVFNIKKRYLSFYREHVFDLWEEDYKEWVEDDHDINHANSIEELKANLRTYRAGFQIKKRIGAVLYRPFLDYLINEASDAYLYGLYKRFNE